MITKETIMSALGRDKTVITDELITNLNLIIADEPEIGTMISENFVTYIGILKGGKFTLDKYLDAITFVSYKLMNLTNMDAYCKTYPDRYEKLRFRYVDTEGLSEDEFEKRVSSYVYAVAKGKLVTSILSQVQLPTKLLNMGLLQEAINTEASLMRSARSEIVREKAANTLIQYLGAEDENRIQLDMGYKKDDVIEQYEVAMKKMVEEQLVQIKAGADVKQIANAAIIEAEVEEV